MEEKIARVQCGEFEVNSGNSDAECFTQNSFYFRPEYHPIKYPSSESLKKIKANPDICKLCVYNKKYENMGRKEWGREKKLNEILYNHKYRMDRFCSFANELKNK